MTPEGCHTTVPPVVDKSLKPRRREGVRSETVEGEVVLYDPANGQAVYLNESAALIWSLCDGAATVGEIIELLERQMGSTEARIAADVEATVDRFLAARLLD